MRDQSPFFIALRQEKIWAVELFVDAGARLDIPSEEGYIPLFYATKFGYDDITMYLSLRCNQDKFEDMNRDTIFMQYMRKKDYTRLTMLLRRGSNINHQNSDYKTFLHYAIENQMESQMIKFLLNNGANPHIEDKDGLDCCDRGRLIRRYSKIHMFHNNLCQITPSLRKKYNEVD